MQVRIYNAWMFEFRSGCPIASSLDIFGDRWSLVLVRTLVFGPKSYSDLLGIPERISTNILADRLKRLEEAGLVTRRSKRRGASQGSYALTPKGGRLVPIVQAIARWGEAELPDRWTSPERFHAARPEDFADNCNQIPG